MRIIGFGGLNCILCVTFIGLILSFIEKGTTGLDALLVYPK
jgi:hypothetical protein